MTKRILLSLILWGGVVFSSWGYDFAQTEEHGQTLYYTITSAVEPYTVKVTFPNSSAIYGGAAYSGFSKPTGSITIPATVTYEATTYTVTEIDQWAFYACNGITIVVIPNTITSIGASLGGASFYNCKNLESITIPNSVTLIGDQSFYGCSNLESISIPNSVSTINRETFKGCTSLTEVNFSNTNLTTIKGGAFANCTSLETITIPATVTSIEYNNSSYYNPFYGCTNLTEIIVAEGNTKYNSGDGANCIIEKINSKDCIIVGCKGTIIPNTVKTISGYSFYGCDGLETITIPTGVTSIDGHAFQGCTSLKSMTIPSTVTSLGTNIFQSCASLESVIINASVTSIPNHTFNTCTSLKSVTIPASVKTIGNSAFYGCSGLTSIVIPSGV